MSRDFLDPGLGPTVTAKSTSLADPMAPYPGNINTMSPGWDDFLWTDVTDALGLDLARYMHGRMSGTAAVGLSIAMQCADVQARDLAKAEMVLWRELANDQYRKVKPSQHWFARMLARRPNPFHTWGQFWRMVGLHLGLAQNAYIVKDIDRVGNLLGLIPVQPARCRERIGNNNKLYYEIAVETEFERAQFGLPVDQQGQAVILPADRVIHLKGRLWNGLTGLSNVELGSPIFGLMKAIAQYQENLFGNNGTVLLAFETDQAFTGDMADASFRRLKEQLAQKVRKASFTGEPLLLEAGLKAKQIAVNAREAMTAEAFNALVMRVCGLMMTPPHKIMAYETVKYENMAAADNQYADDSLVPLAKNIEETMRFSLFTEDELDDLWPEFDRLALMAGDMKTLGDTLDKFVKNGTVTVNEARSRLPLALNPIDGGDVRYVPVNVAMVDENNKVVQQAAQGQNPGAGQQDPNAADGGNPQGTQQQGRSLRVVSSND